MRYLLAVALLLPNLASGQTDYQKPRVAQATGFCQFNHAYSRAYKCAHGTQKSVQCQIWTASDTGAVCRDLCPPMGCTPQE
jgi:hypothetical protein